MIGTMEASAFASDQNIIAYDSFPLYLHDTVFTSIAEIALDDISRLAVRTVDSNTRIVCVVDVILCNEVPPRTLLYLDTISLVTTTVVNVVQGNNTLTHHVSGIVSAKVHSLGMAATVMDVIASEIETLSIRTICTEANLASVMNMALVYPDILTLSYSYAVASTRKLNSA